MKRLSYAFLFLILVSCSPAKKYVESAKNWETEILALEKKDKENTYPENSILFIGSSSIRLWKNIDKDMRLSVRVKDSFIRYDGYAWLEEFEDVNTEWINECICLGQKFERMMEEISAYLASICTIGDIINWSIKTVEESREEGDKYVNKLFHNAKLIHLFVISMR